MSGKNMTAMEESIQLIKQDYEANGRLRLAFVLQTLNKAKEKEKQEIIDA
jgi:predicted PolB exonuclease-like 3'-5' exonuclease